MKKSYVPILMGGIAAGIVGGRFLPPVIGMLAASRRVQAGGDPFAQLMDDHRQILGILNDMVAAPTASMDRSRLFLMLKRKLAKHAMAEEDVVYPIVRNDSANGNERKHLYDEHAEMKVLLYEIENELMAGEDWNTSVGPLRELIRKHIDEEEREIFPQLRQQMEKAAQSKVSGQISREEALIV